MLLCVGWYLYLWCSFVSFLPVPRCVGVFGRIVLVAEGPLVAAISEINQLNDNFEQETQ